MDLTRTILFYYKKLDSDDHIAHIWDVLTSNPDASYGDADARQNFKAHLPIFLDKFFDGCINHLNANAKLDYSKIQKRYLISLVYTGLKADDAPEEEHSIPLKASLFFIALVNNSPVEWRFIGQPVFTAIFSKSLALWDKRIMKKQFLSVNVLHALRKFIVSISYDVTLFSIKIICMLARNIHEHTEQIDFMSNNIYKSDQATYAIYKLFLQTYSLELKKTEIVVPILLKLLQFVSDESPIARENALNFHRLFIKYITFPSWYCNVMVTMFQRYPTQDILLLLNHIELTKYNSIFRMVMNTYIKASTPKDIIEKLGILEYFIDNVHPESSDELRESSIRRIIYESFVRLAHESREVVEKVMSMFIKCFKMRDIPVRRVMQWLLTSQNENISGSSMFELLLLKCDLLWKRINFNVQFIELACLMFLANKSFISPRRIKVIEALCVKSAGSFLKDCLTVFMDIITKYPKENQQLVKSVLAILVNFGLSPGGICDKYIQAIYKLIRPVFDPCQDSHVEFAICDILLSEDFDCVALFKAMEFLKLIRREHLAILIEHQILKSPTSWKLLAVLLDVIDYDKFPVYMQYYYVKFTAPQFYDTDESLYSIKVISKIFTCKLRNNTIMSSDKRIANSLETAFRNFVTDVHVLIRHISEAVMLLLVLARVTGHDTAWMSGVFDKCKLYVYLHIEAGVTPDALTRALFYMGVLIQHADVEFSDEDYDQLEHYIKIEYDNMATGNELLSALVFFYGKYLLKQPQIREEQVLTLQLGMTHPCPLVKQASMAVLYDICNLRLNYYNTIDEQLISSFESDNIEVANSALRILMKLIAEDQMKLSADHYVEVFSILFNRILTIGIFHKDSIERQFVQQHEPLTVKYFIHLIMFFNNYKEHVLFQLHPLTKPHIEYTQVQKNVIFKVTYGNMQRMNQIHILTIATREILGTIYADNMPLSKNGYNVFNDVLMLVLLTAMEYTNETIGDVNEFHSKVISNIIRDFFSVKRQTEIREIDLIIVVEELMKTLLKMLYKTERLNRDIMVYLFPIVVFCTNAFYPQLLRIVADNKYLQNLFYELPNFYNKHKVMIEANPVNLTEKLAKDEWNVYLKDL